MFFYIYIYIYILGLEFTPSLAFSMVFFKLFPALLGELLERPSYGSLRKLSWKRLRKGENNNTQI